MLHYFMTGDPASRDAAIGLAQWVIDMDDGALTPFRWLASGPTGLASATGSMSYHGPGRGPGNSLIACLVAHRLSGDRIFADKADELVRRCIHPRDDLAARNLLDVERRWYYTVFLQALGAYLYEKAERSEIDGMYGYARASLLHYARWMTQHERPYLERPEVLEFPTETWAAQDLRKAEVLWWAAGHSEGAERGVCMERGQFFFDNAVRTLSTSATRHFTRPMILVLQLGARVDWLSSNVAGGLGWPQAEPLKPEAATGFEPQKMRARRRARIALLGVAVAIGTLGLWLLRRYI